MKKVSQTTHLNLEYIGSSRDSSVGRAGDWKSPCPQFKSGSWHLQYEVKLAPLVGAFLMPKISSDSSFQDI